MSSGKNTDCGPKFGTACWLEVPVTDVSRAAAFYSAVLGWNCDDTENAKPPVLEGSSGVHFFNKDILHGAFVKVPEVPSVVNTSNLALSPILLNFMVNSIHETLDKVKSAGGKVHVPRTIISPDMGYFARIIDTEGNLLGVWAKN